MSHFIDLRLEPGLWLALDWSLRWALLVAVVAAWFGVRPPRSAAVRLAVCQLALVAGLALPLVPHWWTGRFLPAHSRADVSSAALGLSPGDSLDASPNGSSPWAKARSAARKTAPTPRHIAALSADGEQADDDRPAATTSDPLTPTTEPFGPWRIAVLLMAGIWGLGASVQLLRLLAASIWLKLLCRCTTPPNLRSQELFDRCRQDLQLRRSVRLGIHPDVSAPLVVGSWRATVLVPADWDGLEPEAQTAVLWHELAHVARFDDLAKGAEELIRALFFFHPLVQWLLNRIDGYREEVCDAAVVRRGVAGPTLAEILLAFSRRPAPFRHTISIKPALPFFHRRSLKRRIAELLEDETLARWSAPLGRLQLVYLGLLAVAVLAGLGSFGLEAADSAASKSAAAKTAAESPTLRRILANWQARQDRTKSLHFAWDALVPNGETSEVQQFMQALIAYKAADLAVRNLSAAIQQHLPVLRGDGPGAPKVVRPEEELARVQARLKAARSALELARKNAARPNLHAPFRPLHNELWLDGDRRLRIDQSFSSGRGYRYLRDDATQSTYAWRSESGEKPLARISSLALTPFAERVEQSRRDLQAFDLGIDPSRQALLPGLTDPWNRVPWMIYRPFGPEGWRPEDFRLVAEDVVLGGTHYVKLARVGADKNLNETYFVDPARDDVIVFGGEFSEEVGFGSEPPIHKSQEFALQIDYQNDRDLGWVPLRWRLKYPQKLATQVFSDTVTGLTINETLPPETFAMNFAPGTVVIDRRTREEYVVPGNDVRSEKIRFDSDKSLRIHELLATRTQFAVDPQPLKDAIGFIATLYQIPILFDDKAFEDRSISTTVEVECKESGIRLRELLTKLLAQADPSVDFKIQDGVLRIAPAGARNNLLPGRNNLPRPPKNTIK
jgi:beta-lactamase regulating signal transducer with metallopeptidase domain